MIQDSWQPWPLRNCHVFLVRGFEKWPSCGQQRLHACSTTRHPSALETPPQYSQAVDYGASLPPVVLLLPLLQPPNHFEQRALGGGRVPVGGPADVLEVLDDTIPILRLRTESLLGLLYWGRSGCSLPDTLE